MKPSLLSGKIDAFMRLCLAQALTGLLFLFSLVSFSVPYLGEIKPPFVLMAIYYWAIFRPTLLPPAVTFIMGIMLDILMGLPLGLNALTFVAIQWFVRDQRRFLMGQPYMMVWMGFVLVSLSAGLLQWSLYGLFHLHWTPPLPPLVSALLGIALFPAVGFLLLRVHRLLPGADPGMTRRAFP